MGAETLRRKKKLRPAPPPPVQAKGKEVEDTKKLKAMEGESSVEILEPSNSQSGGTSSTTTQGKQNGQSLVNGSVTYLATVSALSKRTSVHT